MSVTHSLTINYELLNEARRQESRRPFRIAYWADQLAKGQPLPEHAVGDLFYDVTAVPGSHWDAAVVEQLTGEAPVTLMRHPRRRKSTWGSRRYPVATVAFALMLLRRLGVGVDTAVLVGPLRKKLSSRRDHPLMTQTELAVLWSVDEGRAPNTFMWPKSAVPQPYLQKLADGRVVVGFPNPDGRRVEVIGKPTGRKLYQAALNHGCYICPYAQFRRLVARAQPLAPSELAFADAQ